MFFLVVCAIWECFQNTMQPFIIVVTALSQNKKSPRPNPGQVRLCKPWILTLSEHWHLLIQYLARVEKEGIMT